MTGKCAVEHVLQRAQHEEFIEVDILARALTVSTRRLLRDWRRRGLPECRVGRTVLLPAQIVVRTYQIGSSAREFPGDGVH